MSDAHGVSPKYNLRRSIISYENSKAELNIIREYLQGMKSHGDLQQERSAECLLSDVDQQLKEVNEQLTVLNIQIKA